ncbi:hypothetical protein ACS0TY_034783 [Phlomoides rotata]
MEEAHKEKHLLPSPSLDLQLSISVPSECALKMEPSSCVEALQYQTAEQRRLAAMEKAYAERVRELTRREMELAHSEFSRARSMWETAQEEVQRAETLKERATNSPFMDITCHSCRQRFKPN